MTKAFDKIMDGLTDAVEVTKTIETKQRRHEKKREAEGGRRVTMIYEPDMQAQIQRIKARDSLKSDRAVIRESVRKNDEGGI